MAGVEKVSRVRYRGEEREISSLRKMFIAMSEDMRVIFVKLADRIHNMRTLQYHQDKEKRNRIATETLNLYAPIADRLGIFEFKEILENECFKHLLPERYYEIRSELDTMRANQEAFIALAKQKIYELFRNKDINVLDVSYRVKSPYSIHKKMQRKGYERVADIYDIFAIRIITKSVDDCYDILGTIHNSFVPVPRRFKDYIALPKENHYQSLHTTVVGLFRDFSKETVNRRQPTEIQIRTREMHEHAEIGIAAHFAYSEVGRSKTTKDVSWVNELKEILRNTHDSEFLSHIKIGIFDDRIFVFTPKGDIKTLPRGSTPVDFAYCIHSDVGNGTSIAKVNGRVVSLDHELRNGDQVEIIVDQHKRPSVTWLSFVKTVRAKEVIKASINRERREELIERGRFIINSYLLKHFGKALDKDLSLFNHLDNKELGPKEKEDVLVQIGNLSRRPSSIIRGLEELRGKHLKKAREKSKGEQPIIITAKENTPLPGIIISGEANIPYTFAQCCQVDEYSKIIAHVGRHGIRIHNATCSSLKRCRIERLLPAHFETHVETGVSITVELILEAEIDLLKQLGEIIYTMRLQLEEAHTERLPNRRIKAIIQLYTEEEDYYIFDRFHERLKIALPNLESLRLIKLH